MTQGNIWSRIFGVGSGVVGTATGRGVLTARHEVTFVDTSQARVGDRMERVGCEAVA
jgi:UDPglucose 6-dehydrogenase